MITRNSARPRSPSAGPRPPQQRNDSPQHAAEREIVDNGIAARDRRTDDDHACGEARVHETGDEQTSRSLVDSDHEHAVRGRKAKSATSMNTGIGTSPKEPARPHRTASR